MSRFLDGINKWSLFQPKNGTTFVYRFISINYSKFYAAQHKVCYSFFTNYMYHILYEIHIIYTVVYCILKFSPRLFDLLFDLLFEYRAQT